MIQRNSIITIFLLASSTCAFAARTVKIKLLNGSNYAIKKVIFTQKDSTTGKESTFTMNNVTDPVTKKIPQSQDAYISNIEVIAGNEAVNTQGKWSGDKKFVINTDLSVSEIGN